MDRVNLTDARPLLFSGLDWYEELEEPQDDIPSAWFRTKGHLTWAGQLLSVAAEFASSHGLLDAYRTRLAGIDRADLTVARAKAFSRAVSSPIWVIVHELIVACFLERVLGWQYLSHEPSGNKKTRGDWEFATAGGEVVFVEVKTAEEPEIYEDSGAFSRSPRDKQIRGILKGAYKQLPDDGRKTLVVIIGREMLGIPYGIIHGDVFQTLFGQFQVRFRPFEEDAKLRGGPSFRDMLVHGTKHRRLGCIAGFELSGLDFPQLRFYAIENPFSNRTNRLAADSLQYARRYVVDAAGVGQEHTGLSHEDAWNRMSNGAFSPQTGLDPFSWTRGLGCSPIARQVVLERVR